MRKAKFSFGFLNDFFLIWYCSFQEIYCNSHVPVGGPHDPLPARNGQSNGHKNGFRRDAGLNDLKIAHAIKATQVSKPYPKIKHEGAKYVVVNLFFIFSS